MMRRSKVCRASVIGEHIALDAADRLAIFVIYVGKEVELAIGVEFGVQEQAQQAAFRSRYRVAAQRRQDRHADLEHRFGDDFAGLNQAHTAGAAR